MDLESRVFLTRLSKTANLCTPDTLETDIFRCWVIILCQSVITTLLAGSTWPSYTVPCSLSSAVGISASGFLLLLLLFSLLLLLLLACLFRQGVPRFALQDDVLFLSLFTSLRVVDLDENGPRR